MRNLIVHLMIFYLVTIDLVTEYDLDAVLQVLDRVQPSIIRGPVDLGIVVEVWIAHVLINSCLNESFKIALQLFPIVFVFVHVLSVMLFQLILTLRSVRRTHGVIFCLFLKF